MANGLFAGIVTNLDVVVECVLLLGFSLNMLSGAAIIGWHLRTIEGRQAVRARLALEQNDPFEGMVTMLVIPTLGLLVILCST